MEQKSHFDRKVEKLESEIISLRNRLVLIESFVRRVETALNRFSDGRRVYDITQDDSGPAQAGND